MFGNIGFLRTYKAEKSLDWRERVHLNKSISGVKMYVEKAISVNPNQTAPSGAKQVDLDLCSLIRPF